MALNDLTVKLRLLLADEGAAGKLARASASVAGLKQEVERLGQSTRSAASRMRDGMESVSRQLARIQSVALAIGGVLQGAGMVGSIARTAAEFESLGAAMRAVFGSADAASAEMARLKAESERLGVPLETLARSWLAFAAAARGTALEGAQAREVFTALTEASTVLGLSQSQLEGALMAVQQMISKGAVSSEELRQQLGERLYGSVQIAARSLGMMTDDFSGLLERGMIPAERFLSAFARQLRIEFGQGVAEATNTARAAFARLENAWLELKLEFAQSGFMDALVDAARQLSAAFRDAEFRQSVREFGAMIGTLTRFVVEHGDKLAVLGGVIVGARTGAAMGRIGGPKGAAVGAGVGAVAGGLGAASLLPGQTASGQDEKRVQDVEAAVARLQRRIQDTRQAAAAGMIKPQDARERIAADERRIAELSRARQQPHAAAPGAPDDLGRELMRRRWDDYIKQFRTKSQQLADALDELRERAKVAGISEMSAEFKRAEAAIRAKFLAEKPEKPVSFRLIDRADLDADLAVLKDALARAKAAYDAALEDRLVSIRDYYARKTALEQQEIDAEIGRQQALRAEQRRIQSDPRASEADRIRAKGEVAKIEAELIVLNNRRADAEIANARAAARAERELADALEEARLKLAQLAGTETEADRRAAIERSYRDLKARLAAEGQDTTIIDRLIDVEAASRNLEALEGRWRLALERMRLAQDAANIQAGQGLITTTQAQERIAGANRAAAEALDALLPKMEAAANAIGSDEQIARIQAWRNELAQVKTVVDPVAQAIDTDVRNAFTGFFESIGSGAKSAGEAFRDFARSVVASIQRIAAQKLAERIFGAGGFDIGKIFSGLFKGFAAGGHVTGGTPGRDSVPALLMPGEYVLRREAVQRLGVALLDGINGLKLPPTIVSGRLAFAAGGIVPATAPPQPGMPHIRIVNAVDPDIARDYLDSPAGEQTLLNMINRNAVTIRNILGG